MRVRVELPAHVAWSAEVVVAPEYVNSAHHLDACQLLVLVGRVREAFMHACGHDEVRASGLSYVLADQIVEYRSEAFEGDRLFVELLPHDLNRYGLDVYFRVSVAAEGREVARGKNGLVYFDAAARRVAPLPERVRAGLVAAVAAAAAGRVGTPGRDS